MARLIKIMGCDNPDRTGDVVFIHGLGGDGLTTWHHEPPKGLKKRRQESDFDPGTLDFWPVWLGKARADLGIWSLDYELGRTDWCEQTMPLTTRARNVLELFVNKRLGQQPIVFITHSMGGLLTKQLLRSALDLGSIHQKKVAEQTRGIVFLATPHSGSNWSNWVQFINDRLQKVLRLSVSMEELTYGHDRLKELNGVYRQRDGLKDIPVKSYCETVRFGPLGVVVDEVSATLGIGEEPVPVGKNHLDICKPSPQDRDNDVVHDSVLLFLEDCLSSQSKMGKVGRRGQNTKSSQLSSINPFGDRGRIQDPRRFFGRRLLLQQIFDALGKGSSVSLVGAGGMGKSSILEMVMKWGPGALKRPSEQFVLLNLQRVKNEDDFFEALWHKLSIDPNLSSWQLEDALEQKRFVVCLDEMNLMKNNAKFTPEARDILKGFADGADAPLTLVIASTQPLGELFADDPDRASPLDGLCGAPLRVGSFSEQETYRFLQSRLVNNTIQFSETEQAELYRMTQGHPPQLQAQAKQLYDQRRRAQQGG